MANELYRQVIHLCVGMGAAGLVLLLSQSAFLWVIGVLLLVGVLFLLFLRREFAWLFNLLEREHAAFVGKGALFYGLGLFLTAALFWEHASLAFVMVAIPDAAATVFGTLFKSPPLPYNHRKTLFGSLAFFIAASIILSFKYPAVAVFFVAFLLTALEGFDYREIPFLDDNLVIPLVSGYLLTFL